MQASGIVASGLLVLQIGCLLSRRPEMMEPARSYGCTRRMQGNTRLRGFAFAPLVIVLVACSTLPADHGQVQRSPKATVHTFAGGCAGTVLTDAAPPVWAQGGWNQPATPWPVRWAFGTGNDTVAYVFATELVAGASPRVDGTNNKVLWVARDSLSGAGVAVEGHPLGQTKPALSFSGGPSIVDVPTAGCWTFQVSWSSSGKHSSTINLEVLPSGTVP